MNFDGDHSPHRLSGYNLAAELAHACDLHVFRNEKEDKERESWHRVPRASYGLVECVSKRHFRTSLTWILTSNLIHANLNCCLLHDATSRNSESRHRKLSNFPVLTTSL